MSVGVTSLYNDVIDEVFGLVSSLSLCVYEVSYNPDKIAKLGPAIRSHRKQNRYRWPPLDVRVEVVSTTTPII